MAPGALLSVSKLFLNSYFALLTLISTSLLLGWGALRLQTSTSRRAAMEPAGTQLASAQGATLRGAVELALPSPGAS